MAKFLSKDGKFYMRDGKLLRYSATLEGTWVFNNTLTAWPTSLNNTSVNVRCVSNGSPFENFDFVNGDSSSIKYGTTTVKTTSWSDAAYRIVTFAFPFDGTDNLAFYDWFVTNAIKSDCLNWKLNPKIRCTTTTDYPRSQDKESKMILSDTCTPYIQNVSFTVNKVEYTSLAVSGDYTRSRTGSTSRGFVYYTYTSMTLLAGNSTSLLTLGEGKTQTTNMSNSAYYYYPAGYGALTVTTSEQVLTFTAIPTGAMLTWLLNNAVPQAEVPVSKTWVINETPNTQSVVFPATTSLWKQTINFTSNNIQFTSIEIIDGVNELYYGGTSGVTTYSEGSWDNQAYRTIVFETAPTGELLTWLQANAVPQ